MNKESIKKANYYFKIGTFFYEGSADDKPDFAMALIYFQKADALGHRHAWEFLVKMYNQGLGTPINKKQCALIYEKKALAGNHLAQSEIGKMYLRGIGVERNYQKAIRWLKKSTKYGDIETQYLLGLLYFRGLGIGQDYTRAWLYFKKAALLDWFSADGRCKTPPCFGRPSWFDQRAHILGKLCEMSAKGLGREQDINEAAYYYTCAMSCNTAKANKNLLKLTQEQIKEIKDIYNQIMEQTRRLDPKVCVNKGI